MSLFSHEFHEDSSDEFGTPVDFHRPIAEAVDGFDLDPASGAEPQPLASTRYTEADDGLTSEWFGTVWLNPPFSEKTRWVRKTVSEVNAGNVDTAVVLLPVDTSTQLFHDYVADATAICFVESRLSFVGGDRNPNFGILLAVYGDAPSALLDVLDRKGAVFDTTHQRAEQQELVTDGGRRTGVSRTDPSGTGDGFAPFFAQNESGRLRVVCSQCKRTWYPTPIAGISRTAGSPYCPDCGTDFRVWVAYQQIFGGEFADAQ